MKEESYDIKIEVESDEEDGEHVLPEPTTAKRTSYGKSFHHFPACPTFLSLVSSQS